ncbi:MAG: serine/threonine protein kinase [Ahniella sp.]|nr:serine/threonine protein kinase [Ahniella sp.]
MALDVDRLQRVSMWFDELHDLAPEARAEALASLQATEPDIFAQLARWLAKDAEVGVLDGSTQHQIALRNGGTEPHPDRSGQHVGPYELVRHVGRGGMGDVYEARRTGADFDQRVAIKLLRRGLDSDDIIRRFLRERRILAQLDHPGIARLVDGGVTSDGLPFLVMEFVEGRGLMEAATTGSWDVSTRLNQFLKICDSVAYAHRRLIVHRDLKPSNVLIASDGQPKLLDFGIAKLLDEEDHETLTRTGMRVLTPSYAAPEQLLGEPIGTPADAYALGVILYELLTGVCPHRRTSADLERINWHPHDETLIKPSVAVLRTAATADPATQRLSRQLDGDLDAIILFAMRREPERRYRGAAEFADDIRRFLEGLPVRAEVDSRTYRIRKFVQRHRGGVTAAALAVLGLTGGLVIALWQADVARSQAMLAQEQRDRAESIKEFTLSLFREQDPMARVKAEPKSATELIRLGIDRTRTQFADDPEQRSELLNDLGEIQNSLGDYASAHEVLEETVAQRTELTSAGRIKFATAQSNLAVAKVGLGDYEAGLPLLQDSAAILTKLAGADAPETLKTQARLVSVLTQLGRLDEAKAVAEQILPITERVFGAKSPQAIARRTDLLAVLEQSAQYDAALAEAQVLVDLIEAVHGKDTLLLVRPLALQGDILRMQQHYDAADPLYVRAIDLTRRHKSTPQTARLLLRRGDLLRRIGKLDEADALIKESIALLPPASPDLAQAQVIRGVLLRARGEFKMSAAEFLAAHQSFLGALGRDSVFPWIAAVEHAISERQAGSGLAAEPLLLESVSRLRAIAEPDSSELMQALSALANWRTEQKRFADAAPLHAEVVTICSKVYGPSHGNTRLGLLAQADNFIGLGSDQDLTAARRNLDTVATSVTAEAPLAAEQQQELDRIKARLAAKPNATLSPD